MSHPFSDYLFWVVAVTTFSSTKQFPRTIFTVHEHFKMAEVLRELRDTERCRIHCHYGNSRDSREFLSIRWGTKIIFDSGLNLPEQLIAQIAFVYCRIEYELDRSNRHAILLQTRGPFLESPVNFSGPKSNIQIEI